MHLTRFRFLWYSILIIVDKHSYFEVGNGSRHTLKRVPEMMDTPPIRNNYAFIILQEILSSKVCKLVFNKLHTFFMHGSLFKILKK